MHRRATRRTACLIAYACFSSAAALELGALRQRMRAVEAASTRERAMLERGSGAVPVIAFDALLPHQRLSLTVGDATFSKLLADLGLGGLLCVTSVNQRRRMLRRHGVLARLELVDAVEGRADVYQCTIAGVKRCRICGPSANMTARVGRWRRKYDEDGREAVLGWGVERFVDAMHIDDAIPAPRTANGPETWSECSIELVGQDADASDKEIAHRAASLEPLLDRWIELARDASTYDNIDVVAAARRSKGEPGLDTDPARLIDTVLDGLGPRPANPTDLAFWGAALINPLPPLGVSLEIRGPVLEAPDALSRLVILESGVRRSIANLEGVCPL